MLRFPSTAAACLLRVLQFHDHQPHRGVPDVFRPVRERLARQSLTGGETQTPSPSILGVIAHSAAVDQVDHGARVGMQCFLVSGFSTASNTRTCSFSNVTLTVCGLTTAGSRPRAPRPSSERGARGQHLILFILGMAPPPSATVRSGFTSRTCLPSPPCPRVRESMCSRTSPRMMSSRGASRSRTLVTLAIRALESRLAQGLTSLQAPWSGRRKDGGESADTPRFGVFYWTMTV